jgi:hypothetical protein
MSSINQESDENKGRSGPADALRLVFVNFCFALLLAWPAWLMAEEKGLIGLAVSAVLCTAPGCLIVSFKSLVSGSKATLVLASTGLRMFVVMLGALVARFGVAGYGMREFFLWLILFYLFTLVLETRSLLTARSKPANK